MKSYQEILPRMQALTRSAMPVACVAAVCFILGWIIGSPQGALEMPAKFRTIDTALIPGVLGYDHASPLLFNSGLFLLLFVAFLALYRLARGARTVRMVLVIAFSLYFYYKSSAGYCFVLLGVCMADYVVGALLGCATRRAERRMWVWVNVLMNVGMLVYFKYFNLLASTFAQMASVDFSPLDIVLPAGISFFSFRSISYIVDIYRGRIEPCEDLLDYIFYLTYFPPLLAGPVVRAAGMLPQIRRNDPATRAMVSEGLFLIVCGLVKKVVVADYIAGNFVDRVFDNPLLYSGFENFMGVAGFTIQIYCDFSGYSDMAIGLALLMGFRFLPNFDSPFKAANPSEFWRRWHISLSSWLRDYIYIPLGGNRCGRVRHYFNLTATMLIGGLWHGASWMYLLWGGYNALLLCGHKALKGRWRTPRRLRASRRLHGWNVALTLLLVMIGMMLFRAPSLACVGQMMSQIFSDFRPAVILPFIESYTAVAALIGGAFALHFLPGWCTDRARGLFSAAPAAVQALVLALVIFIIIQVRQAEIVPFVYLQY